MNFFFKMEKLKKKKREEKMNKLFIDYTDYESDRFMAFKPKELKSNPKVDPNNPTAPAQSVTYYTIPLEYKYRVTTEDGKEYDTIGPLHVQFPTLTTNQGISYRNANTKETLTRDQYIGIFNSEQKAKLTCSVPVRFKISDSAQRDLIGDPPKKKKRGETEEDRVEGFYQRFVDDCIERLIAVKGKIGITVDDDYMKGLLNNGGPIHYPRDDKGKIIEDGIPTKFFPLLSIGKFGAHSRRETTFSLPIKDEKGNFKKADWKLLSDVEMDFVPIVCQQSLTIAAGKIHFKDFIDEAMIKRIIPANSERAQTKVLEKAAKNQAEVDRITREMEVLMNMHSNAASSSAVPALPPPPPASNEKEEEEKKKLQEQLAAAEKEQEAAKAAAEAASAAKDNGYDSDEEAERAAEEARAAKAAARAGRKSRINALNNDD